MRIVLIHYHLKRGGVSSVIGQQVEAMRSMGWDPMVLVGETPAGDYPCDVRVVEGLAYDQHLPSGLRAEDVAASILKIIKQKWPQGPDVLHVHNPTLAKNSLLQKILKHLQSNGWPILCQIHDFAEDGRPQAYFDEPYLENCHYAAINSRDFNLLIRAGLDRQGCHLLPNTVGVDPTRQPAGSTGHGMLYPIRAIRRKNIGEAILIANFLPPAEPLIITLPPNSPDDIKSYERWKGFVGQHGLNVHFDAGLSAEFSTLLAQCRFVITTSITEGFGFAFVESWAAGKPLWGRRLSGICQGFEANGLRLDWLYHQLRVPLGWLDRHRLESKWKSSLSFARHRFSLPLSDRRLDSAWRAVSAGGTIDFGLLDEGLQQVVIQKGTLGSEFRARLIELNPFLEHPGPPDNTNGIIAQNREAIVQHYRPGLYARRLKQVYQKTSAMAVVHRLNKVLLAETFLDADHFSLLKWSGFDDECLSQT